MSTPAVATFMGVHAWVTDMAAAVAFYRAIGLTVPDGAEAQEFINIELPGGGSLALGTYELTRAYDPGFEPAPGKGSMALQFGLPSREAVDELHARLVSQGYRIHLAPFDAFWGARYFEVHDADGNVAGFHSPRDPGRNRPVPGRP